MPIHYQINPGGPLSGEITVPGDKSISHRALILSAIADGRSVINNLLLGADNLATLNALRFLGVSINLEKSTAIIDGLGRNGLKQSQQSLNLGNSGTGMRLLAGLLAAQPFSSYLLGDASLSTRPMARVVEPLQRMGANIQMSPQKTAPLAIQGQKNLKAIHYQLPIASAQVKSAILLAGLYAQGKTAVIEKQLSRDHTERMLTAFAYPVEKGERQISLEGGKNLHPINFTVPGDFSSAAFFIVAALITPGSEIIIRNVGVNPTRIGLIDILRKMGAQIEIQYLTKIIEPIADVWVRHSALKGIEIPVELIPSAIDEFPIIFIAAACAKGYTILHQAEELRVKESDRLLAMATGLSQLGIENKLLADGLGIKGGKFKSGAVNSFKDHRVAMAFAIAGHIAESAVTVHDCENIATSFPDFLTSGRALGLQIGPS